MYKFRKIDFDVTRYFEDMQRYFEGRKDISLVYIFGSYSTGMVTPISDVDIAYLPAADFDFHTEMSLELDVVRILHTEEVDCINLCKSPHGIRYKVVTKGKIILCQDSRVREFFEVRSLLCYLDFQPIRERYFQRMQEDIMKGGV